MWVRVVPRVIDSASARARSQTDVTLQGLTSKRQMQFLNIYTQGCDVGGKAFGM